MEENNTNKIERPLSTYLSTEDRVKAAKEFAECMINNGSADPDIENEYFAYIKKQKQNLAPDENVLQYLLNKGGIKEHSKDYERYVAKRNWKWKKSENGQGLCIVHYEGNDNNIVVPADIAGDPVVEIGRMAFGYPGPGDVFTAQSFVGSLHAVGYNDYWHRPFDPDSRRVSEYESITLPETVSIIGPEAFRNCSSLRKVNIPANVKELKYATFYGCSSLTEIEIPDECDYSQAYNCFSKTGITEIKLPGNSKIITVGLFMECPKLETITIPEGVETIEFGAFAGCHSLKSINIPGSVITIGNGAFAGDYNLSEFNISENTLGYRVLDGLLVDSNMCINSALTGTSIPDGIKKIGKGAFAFSNVNKVVIPESVEVIEEAAFELSDVNFVIFSSSVDCIPAFAFRGCRKLKSIEIPSTIKCIRNYAFYSTGLEECILNEGLETMEPQALGGFKKLVLPKSFNGFPDDWFGSVNYSFVNTVDEIYSCSKYPQKWIMRLGDKLRERIVFGYEEG